MDKIINSIKEYWGILKKDFKEFMNDHPYIAQGFLAGLLFAGAVLLLFKVL